jgi:hypothetical protein
VVPQHALNPRIAVDRGSKLAEGPVRLVDFLKQIYRDRRIDEGKCGFFFELTVVSYFIECGDAIF